MSRYNGSLINDAKTAKANGIEAAAAVVVSGTFAGPITRVGSLRAKAGSRGKNEFPADPAFAAMAANALTLAAGRHAAATATTTALSPSSPLYTSTTATTTTTSSSSTSPGGVSRGTGIRCNGSERGYTPRRSACRADGDDDGALPLLPPLFHHQHHHHHQQQPQQQQYHCNVTGDRTLLPRH